MRYFSVVVCITILFGGSNASDWKKMRTSLVRRNFTVTNSFTQSDAEIVVVRIDPSKYRLKLLSASEFNVENMTAKEWAKAHGCIGAFNAGMYLTDYRSNVGYLKNGNHLNNPRINKQYYSFTVFNPKSTKDSYFKMYDSDVTDISKVVPRYKSVVQNLRLIKRSRNNRWGQQEKRWSEIALGEDASGNILVLFCKSPFSMYEFNQHILKLPIDLVCAQHLEGGPEASLYVEGKMDSLQLTGSYTSGWDTAGTDPFLPLPNVIGIVER